MGAMDNPDSHLSKRLIFWFFLFSTGVIPVLQAVQMMKDAGLKPNTYCMNSLMAVNVQARQPNTALEIFKEMERDGIPRDVVRGRFCRVYARSLALFCRSSVSLLFVDRN